MEWSICEILRHVERFQNDFESRRFLLNNNGYTVTLKMKTVPSKLINVIVYGFIFTFRYIHLSYGGSTRNGIRAPSPRSLTG